MKKLFLILAAVALTFTLAACKEDEVPDVNVLPTISGTDVVNIRVGDAFDPLEGVSAADEEDGDLDASIEVSGTVDTSVIGTYVITYSVTDLDGGNVTVARTVNVNEIDIVFPTGFFNYKFADTELRHTLMAAAEGYIMNNMFGGIPLFASGSFNLYSSRLQLPVDEYVAVMGYGTAFGTMSGDDSTVLMDDGEPGEVGEFTYRTTIGNNPGTFNQWLYDTSTDSDLMSNYFDALYVYEFNADKSGYEVNPSMAAANPVPVDATFTETGKEVANVWTIELRDDLVWKYHPDTDISALPAGHEVIDANDFIETFKLALDEGWFRAISGGGDFLAETSAIVNAQEYLDGEATWEEVGLSVGDDDLTLEFNFVNEMSDWNVRYWLSSFVMTPINIELYDAYEAALVGDESNPYGTLNTNTAFHGAYYVDYYEADKILRYKENELYHSPDDFFYTGYTYSIINDSTVIFQEFISGKLEATGLPTAEVENYLNDPRLKKVPGATTYRIMINGLGTVEAQRELFPDSSWIPEPLLANEEFKMAMFFAIDRKTLAEDILLVRTTNMYYFSDAYLVDAELGVPYRQTEQGMSVGDGLSPDTYGFNFDAARALYLSAIEDLIASGAYEAGTAANPTEIVIELNNYSDSESWDLACAYFKTAFEDTFKDEVNHINVIVEIYTKDFPAIYYDYMMIGEFDMSVGGISGSTLDAASFLDTYSTDNRSGFSLNWGIDSSVAEIEVIYTTFDGVRHREMWSFDAIASALNGEVYLSEGAEADTPALKDIEVTSTTATFTVEKFNDPDYTNFRYTVQWYDPAAGYLDVDGMVDVAITAETMTITGLNPAFDDYPTTYIGDYQIVLLFDYVADLTKDGVSVAPWFMTESIVADYTDVTDATSSVITLVLNDDIARTLTAVEVLDWADYSDPGATIAINGLEVTLTGLSADVQYQVIFTFDDGHQDYVVVEYVTP